MQSEYYFIGGSQHSKCLHVSGTKPITFIVESFDGKKKRYKTTEIYNPMEFKSGKHTFFVFVLEGWTTKQVFEHLTTPRRL